MTVVPGYQMVLCGNSDDVQQRYRGRIEKVKFGVPINEAFSHDIPATLLVLLLKVNKEGPMKKDIWRAPGNQAQVRKLSHVMQHGRLVNIANFSVYTAASVIKKFLSKLPGGIFGLDNEQLLFNSVVSNSDADKQRQVFCRIFCSLPVPSQHLLVLLFGTFRMVADGASEFGTKMTPEAIGISVAPSLFHSCIHDGQKVKVEDVQRFKLASQVVSNIVKSFGHTNLFPRECYEFYARITGRTLRVDENWLFTFQYPSRAFSQPEVVVSDVDDDLPECSRAAYCALAADTGEPSEVENYRPHSSGAHGASVSDRPSRPSQRKLHTKLSNRLSSSVGEVLSASECLVASCLSRCEGCGVLESTRSLSVLESVHQMQTRRMQCRSEWFLSPIPPIRSPTPGWDSCCPHRLPMDRVRSADPPMRCTTSSPHPEIFKDDLIDHVTGVHTAEDSVSPYSSRHSIEKDADMSHPIYNRPSHISSPSYTRREEQFEHLLKFWNLDNPKRKYIGESTLSSANPNPPTPLGERRVLQENSRQGSVSPGQWNSLQTTAACPVQITAVPVSATAVSRRRSWRTHYVRPTRSIDCPEVGTGSLDVDERNAHLRRVDVSEEGKIGHAHSISGERWPTAEISDTPRMKKNLMKKTSTKF